MFKESDCTSTESRKLQDREKNGVPPQPLYPSPCMVDKLKGNEVPQLNRPKPSTVCWMMTSRTPVRQVELIFSDLHGCNHLGDDA